MAFGDGLRDAFFNLGVRMGFWNKKGNPSGVTQQPSPSSSPFPKKPSSQGGGFFDDVVRSITGQKGIFDRHAIGSQGNEVSMQGIRNLFKSVTDDGYANDEVTVIIGGDVTEQYEWDDEQEAFRSYRVSRYAFETYLRTSKDSVEFANHFPPSGKYYWTQVSEISILDK